MKPTDHAMHHDPGQGDDPELTALLHSWQVETRHDPALAARVRQRIEAEPASGLLSWIDRLALALMRPAGVLAMVGLFAAAGFLMAQFQIHQQHEARLQRLAAEYVQSIDPILMTADHPAPAKPSS